MARQFVAGVAAISAACVATTSCTAVTSHEDASGDAQVPQRGAPGDAGLRTDGAARSQEAGAAASCSATDPTVCPDPPPHFADVSPIFQRRCATCHSGEAGGPWPLTNYDNIAAWADVIQTDLLDCSMPPADGGVSITGDELDVVLTWIACGTPQ